MTPEDSETCRPNYIELRDALLSSNGPAWPNRENAEALLDALGRFRDFAKRTTNLNGLKHLLKTNHPNLVEQIDAAESLFALSKLFSQRYPKPTTNEVQVLIWTSRQAVIDLPKQTDDEIRVIRREISKKFSEKNAGYLTYIRPKVARDSIQKVYPNLELPNTDQSADILFSVAIAKLLDYHAANYLQMRTHERQMQRIVDDLTHNDNVLPTS